MKIIGSGRQAIRQSLLILSGSITVARYRGVFLFIDSILLMSTVIFTFYSKHPTRRNTA
jgi:hypothetical protein